MLETLKRKRLTQQNKQSRKCLASGLVNHSRIGIGSGGGISKKYKTRYGKYTQRIRKITPARYDDSGNLIGGGIFDYFKLKLNVRKIKGIVGKLNVLERQIKKEIDSYEIQANQFKTMAEKAAEFQTNYIITKRKNIILKNYRKDTEEIDQKTDKNVIATIDSEIKRSDSDYKQAEKLVAAQYKEVGKDIKQFIYLSNKYQKELKKFAQIEELSKKVAFYQLKINNMRTKALDAEGRSDLSKTDKAVLAKYRANKADYDYVVSLTEQSLQNVQDLQQRSSELTLKMEYYKNQFGTYKKEGYESKGAQGSIKIGGKLKEWSDLTDKLAASLLGVSDNSKNIITTLEEIKKAITKCRTKLVTVPEYYNKDANANAILWFEHDVEDMIKVMKEIKKHFGDMKNEFYNQISAENMYSNYNYNSTFLRVIEVRLKFYGWMIDKALKKDQFNEMNGYKDIPKRDIKSGGYYNLIGGSGRPTGRTPSTAPKDDCKFLKEKTPLIDIKLVHLVSSLMSFTKGLNRKDNECYGYNKSEFINVIENKFARYLLAAYLNKDILNTTEFNADTVLKDNIAKFDRIIKLLKENTNWDDDTKKQIAEKFNGFMPSSGLDKDITSIKSTKKIPDLFNNDGSKKTGITDAEEKKLQDYIEPKSYIKDFLAKLLTHTPATEFYGVLKYDESHSNLIENYINNLPPESAASATTTSPSNTKTKNSKTPNDKLNKDELAKIKGYTDSIKDGLGKLGIYPSSNFETIVDLLNKVESALEKLYDNLGDVSNKNILGLDKYIEYLFEIKQHVDSNNVNIDDDDLNDMNTDLGNLEADYRYMNKFYDDVRHTTNESTAKKELDELIDEYYKSKGKEAIGKIIDKIRKKN